MKYIAANIDDDLMERVDKVADRLKISRSALVRLALASYLERPHRLVQDDPEPATAHSPMTTEG
jgi:metal-responsive CopG/Arc/MetJ family transcriptional regulator